MSEIRLSNGKTLEEALKEFRLPRKPLGLKANKYPYHKAFQYTQVLDECFGIGGYEMDFSDVSTVGLGFNQSMTTLKCDIRVLDENRNVCYTMSGYGTYELQLQEIQVNGKGTGKYHYINLNNVGTFACTSAIKAACKSNGVFGCREEAEDQGDGFVPSYQSNSSRSSGASGAKKSNSKPAENMAFYVKKPAEVVRSDERTGRPVYKVYGHLVTEGGKQYVEEQSEILCYPNLYGDCIVPFESFIKRASNGGPGSVVHFKVSRVENKKSSYTFRGFGGR